MASSAPPEILTPVGTPIGSGTNPLMANFGSVGVTEATVIDHSRVRKVEWYHIKVTCGGRSWVVKRRFSLFYRLHVALSKLGELSVQRPAKTIFNLTSSQTGLVARRQVELQTFLNGILTHDFVQSSVEFRQFLGVERKITLVFKGSEYNPLGIILEHDLTGHRFEIVGYALKPDGEKYAAEEQGDTAIHDALLAINDQYLAGMKLSQVVETVQNAAWRDNTLPPLKKPFSPDLIPI